MACRLYFLLAVSKQQQLNANKGQRAKKVKLQVKGWTALKRRITSHVGPGNATDAHVGKTIDDRRPFTGFMDEFRMYTRALSQDEILEVMQGM